MHAETVLHHCDCGDLIRLPREAIGRRARCRRCQSVFTVEDDRAPLELADEPDRVERARLAREAEKLASLAENAVVAPDAAPAAPSMYDRPSREAFAAARAARRRRPYFIDAAGAFFWPFRPAALFTLIVLAALHAVGQIIPNMFVGIFTIGVLAAYLFDVVVTVAGGEDDLPDIGDLTDPWDGVVLPYLSMAGAIVVCMAPALAARIFLPVFGVPVESAGAVAIALIGVGVLVLPVAILGVALGGVEALLRLDLLVRTILAAPLAYASVLGTILIAILLRVLIEMYAMNGPPPQMWSAQHVLAPLVASLLDVFVLSVAMAQLGLFYRHFSDAFPWSAG